MLPKVEKLLMFSCPHENQKSSFFLRFLRKAEENVWPLFPCCPKFFTAILVGEKVTFISPSKKLRTFWFLKKIVPNHQNSTGNHEVRFVHVSGSLQLLPKQTKLSSSVLFGATSIVKLKVFEKEASLSSLNFLFSKSLCLLLEVFLLSSSEKTKTKTKKLCAEIKRKENKT